MCILVNVKWRRIPVFWIQKFEKPCDLAFVSVETQLLTSDVFWDLKTHLFTVRLFYVIALY